MSKLYLIDGMSLVFRAYHAMSASKLKSPEGEPTSAVFAFANILTSLLEKENPEKLAVVFDRSEPTFRHEMYPEYKANRDAFPEELVPQLARIKELLDCFSIPRIEKPGYEADDIIGTISSRASSEGTDVVCLTSDKDFYQLVNDKVKLYKPSKKSNEDFDVVGLEEVKEKFGGTPAQVIDVLALIGDTSDNVPGVKGIGDKTAIPLVQKFGSVENIYEHINEIEKERIRNMLLQDKDKAFLAKKLVTIMVTVPLEPVEFSFDWTKPKYPELEKLFTKLGFNNLKQRWQKKASANVNTSALEESEPEKIKQDDIVPEIIEEEVIQTNGKNLAEVTHNYTLVDTEEKLSKMLDELKPAKVLAVDLETNSLDRMKCDIVGISLCPKEGRAFYIAVEREAGSVQVENETSDSGQNDLFSVKPSTKSSKIIEQKLDEQNNNFIKLPVKFVLDEIRPMLENHAISKCGQNIKFDAFILKRYGVHVSPIEFDTMVASYLINPDVQHNLDAISQKWLGYTPIPITNLIGEKKATQISMEGIDPTKICDYAAEDADLALKLRNKLAIELKIENLEKLAYEIEFPLIEVLIDMEMNGVAIDTKVLKEISDLIVIEADKLSKQIFSEAGTSFNIDSPKQLAHILFEKMMIPTMKKNKTGYSTDVQVLSELAFTYPIAQMILDYRQLTKLKSTYVDALPALINNKTGRIHTTFNQTVASTGRLSSTDPNLQNIPIRTELGRTVRKAFVAQKDDRVILSADYSQIELRIMAYYCMDKQLISAFKDGLDIHSATAAILFELPLDKVDADMRRVAKTVNFGIMYGLGSFGLAQRLGIGKTESQTIIDNYFGKYPGIKRYIEDTKKTTREKGYAETLCGRRRYFENIKSNNHNVRAADERAAINLPIQGTASDMMKLAMLKVHREMKKRKMKSLMTIQVHDELVFEVFNDELEELTALVKKQMESALPLGEIPVLVETGTGKNWYEAH